MFYDSSQQYSFIFDIFTPLLPQFLLQKDIFERLSYYYILYILRKLSYANLPKFLFGETFSLTVFDNVKKKFDQLTTRRDKKGFFFSYEV